MANSKLVSFLCEYDEISVHSFGQVYFKFSDVYPGGKSGDNWLYSSYYALKQQPLRYCNGLYIHTAFSFVVLITTTTKA